MQTRFRSAVLTWAWLALGVLAFFGVSRASGLDEKLDGIILKSVAIQNVPLTQAIDVLRKMSAGNDPGGKGINIFLKIRADFADPKVTLKAENISLRNALRQIAAQAGFTLDTSQPVAVGLVPEEE